MDLKYVHDYIRGKTKELITKYGTKKVQIGKILGKGAKEVRQQEFSRAQRFLDGDSSIKVGAVMALAQYYKKPLSYFFPPELLFPDMLTSTEDSKHTQKAFQEIAENLQRLGFDEDFIKTQVRQLRAMEAYKDGEN